MNRVHPGSFGFALTVFQEQAMEYGLTDEIIPMYL
jgi:hypothetical protein